MHAVLIDKKSRKFWMLLLILIPMGNEVIFQWNMMLGVHVDIVEYVSLSDLAHIEACTTIQVELTSCNIVLPIRDRHWHAAINRLFQDPPNSAKTIFEYYMVHHQSPSNVLIPQNQILLDICQTPFDNKHSLDLTWC